MGYANVDTSQYTVAVKQSQILERRDMDIVTIALAAALLYFALSH